MATLPPDFIERVDSKRESVVVFSVVRNEILRLRSWLRHYRQMGAKAFAIIDNGSTDGTLEYLTAQPDVALTLLTDSFASTSFGMDWLNEFLRRVDPSTWVLFADADEYLIFRDWPNVSLHELVSRAQQEGSTAICAFMLDMYPPGAIEDATISEDEDPFRVAPCFDSEYHFRKPPRKPWHPPVEGFEVVGGPRLRMLSSYRKEIATTWFSYVIRGQIDRLLPIVPDRALPLVVKIMPQDMPQLVKAPLARAGSAAQYRNNHKLDGAIFFHENAILCHFKFLADFAARVRTEAARGEHFRRGAEYIKYADAINRKDRICLRYDRTVRFQNTDQLVNLGLIRNMHELL